MKSKAGPSQSTLPVPVKNAPPVHSAVAAVNVAASAAVVVVDAAVAVVVVASAVAAVVDAAVVMVVIAAVAVTVVVATVVIAAAAVTAASNRSSIQSFSKAGLCVRPFFIGSVRAKLLSRGKPNRQRATKRFSHSGRASGVGR